MTQSYALANLNAMATKIKTPSPNSARSEIQDEGADRAIYRART